MRCWNASKSLFNPWIAGIGVIAAVAGCSKSEDNPTLPQPATGAGAGGTAMPSAGGAAPSAGTGSPMGGTSAPVGTAGASGAAGNTPPVGTAGSAGGMPEAGSGGTPEAGAGGAGGGGPDTSGFLENCMQGAANWGTPSMAGPCKSGVTRYGAMTEYGPYGVRSEYNVGEGFDTGGVDDSAACVIFIAAFAADPQGSADLQMTHDLDWGLHSVFYPGVMPEGEKFPVITWGNGTCAMPEGYGPLLRYVASFGYIVVAANNRQVAGGQPMIRSIDWIFAENDNPESKFYQKVDTEKVGAMGHSQGGGATIAAASDPRIDAVIIWNGGTSASKPFLAVSGDRDLGGTAAGMANAANAAQLPAAWIWYHQVPTMINGQPTGGTAGHLTLMMESERVIQPAVAWWDMMLKGKPEAKQMFVGDNCTLCDASAFPSRWVMPATPPSLEYGHNSMLQ